MLERMYRRCVPSYICRASCFSCCRKCLRTFVELHVSPVVEIMFFGQNLVMHLNGCMLILVCGWIGGLLVRVTSGASAKMWRIAWMVAPGPPRTGRRWDSCQFVCSTLYDNLNTIDDNIPKRNLEALPRVQRMQQVV